MAKTRAIWECDEKREEAWEADPARAAMLAYLEVMGLWHEQVERGQYRGVPCLRASNASDHGPSTLRSRPVRFSPDESAGQYLVPGAIRRRWLNAG